MTKSLQGSKYLWVSSGHCYNKVPSAVSKSVSMHVQDFSMVFQNSLLYPFSLTRPRFYHGANTACVTQKTFHVKSNVKTVFLIKAKVRMRFTLHVQPFIHVVIAMRCKTSLSSYKICQCIHSSCLRVRTVGLPTRRRLPTKASERHSIELSIASAVLSRP